MSLVQLGDKDRFALTTHVSSPDPMPCDAGSTDDALNILAQRGIKITVNGQEVKPDSSIAEENARIEASVAAKRKKKRKWF